MRDSTIPCYRGYGARHLTTYLIPHSLTTYCHPLTTPLPPLSLRKIRGPVPQCLQRQSGLKLKLDGTRLLDRVGNANRRVLSKDAYADPYDPHNLLKVDHGGIRRGNTLPLQSHLDKQSLSVHSGGDHPTPEVSQEWDGIGHRPPLDHSITQHPQHRGRASR